MQCTPSLADMEQCSQRISLEVGMTTGLQNLVAFDWLRPNREVLSQRMILALLEMCDTVSSAL